MFCRAAEDLVDWKMSNARPDEIVHSIENMISSVEEYREHLDFADSALAELVEASNSLDRELDEDKEVYRKYRNLINEKNRAREDALSLFYRIRRFIRRDKGHDSVEYGQLKDRAVRKAREEEGILTSS